MTNGIPEDTSLNFVKVTSPALLPPWAPRPEVVRFFHETMKPYEDRPEDIERALDYAFSLDEYAGGFLMLADIDQTLAGALLMLTTGMGGYVPEHLLVFVSVNPELRGRGIGQRLIERSLAECDGSVKLHVDHDNPARRLYERLGFAHSYAEMRLRR